MWLKYKPDKSYSEPKNPMRLLFILYLVCSSTLSSAGEIKSAHVEHKRNDYRLHIIMHVDAGQEDLLALLTDYDQEHLGMKKDGEEKDKEADNE